MASFPGRENVAVALYALVNTAVGGVVNLVTSSRRLRDFMNVKPQEMPALFMRQLPEDYVRSAQGTIGLPPTRTMRFEFWLYTADPIEPSVVPSTQQNNVMDAVEVAMSPSPITGANTLDGPVVSARISGKVDYIAAPDGKSILIIPIEVLLP